MRFGVPLLTLVMLCAAVAEVAASGFAAGVRSYLAAMLDGAALRSAPARAESDTLAASAAASANPSYFYFARAQYTGDGVYPDYKDWRTDFPKADRQFLTVLKRLARLNAHDRELAVRLDDPALRHLPYLYAVEVGHMELTDAEVKGLREYLLAGGFLVVDDFWGTREWRHFEKQMARVLPDYSIVDLPLDHPLFHAYYDIDKVVQVPNVGTGVAGGPTHESDGYTPMVRGILDERGRLMVAINWNTDLGDGWEWAEHPQYPLVYSTYAYQMGTNLIVYAMSH